MEKICALLNITSSIRVQMIPGSSRNLDKKSFNWTIDVINEYEILISFKFDNPLYISQDDLIDTVRISFWNTNLYMFPVD